MSLARVNWSARLITRLVDCGAFRQHPFVLVDVGCSGGIEAYWQSFGDQLNAVGFDILVNEVERLRRAQPADNIRYIAAQIAKRDFDGPGFDAAFYPRTSSAHGVRTTGWTVAPVAPTLASNKVTLNDAIVAAGLGYVDFLKTDTDGHDLEVLESGFESLRDKGVLGISVESLFHGQPGARSNTWRNIDALLTSLGFCLFDMDVYRYSRVALPDKFVTIEPTQTNRGQVLWADVVYLRDPIRGDGQLSQLNSASLLKLASVYELFGLNDCAAELLQQHPTVLPAALPLAEALDILAGEWHPGETHEHVTKRFLEDVTSFYTPLPEG